MSVLERIYYLHDRIQAGTYPNTRVLVDQFEISPATAHRDVAYLRDRLLAPLAFDQRKNGYYYTSPFRLPFENSPDMALLLGLLSNLAAESGLGKLPELKEFGDRLGQVLFPGREDIGDLLYCEWIQQEEIGAHIFARVLEGLRRQRQLAIDYRDSLNRISSRTIDPLKLVNYQGRWYLLAWCHLRRDRRLFHLARMTRVNLSENPCTHRLERDDPWLSQSFGIFKGPVRFRAVIRFTGRAADLVRYQRWHPDQVMEHRNGALFLTLPVADERELKGRILQFGAGAELVEPDWLRQKLRWEIQTMADLYRN